MRRLTALLLLSLLPVAGLSAQSAQVTTFARWSPPAVGGPVAALRPAASRGGASVLGMTAGGLIGGAVGFAGGALIGGTLGGGNAICGDDACGNRLRIFRMRPGPGKREMHLSDRALDADSSVSEHGLSNGRAFADGNSIEKLVRPSLHLFLANITRNSDNEPRAVRELG